MKLTRHIIIDSWALIMTLLALSVHGQETVTKSGTPIRPVDKTAVLFPNQTKTHPSAFDHTAGTYVVVTRPDLLEPLQPLLRWKRQQGYRVELLCTTTNHRDSIRARLTERYSNFSSLLPAQRYVLLVGDVNRIQAFAGQYTPSGLTNRATDLYYGEYTGDYLPEAYVGRLSVTDSAELEAVVTKIIAYEQGEWADSTNQMLFAAGFESRNPAPTTTNGQVNYLSQLAATYLPELDTVCFRNPDSQEQTDSLLQSLNHSNALVNYTAHCSVNGWERPYVTYNTIDTLDNRVATLFVNNCCLSNAFDGTCFGERLLRRPTGGAAAVIGATNETIWNEDYYWAVGAKCPPSLLPERDSTRKGAFDGMFCHTEADATDEAAYTLGAMMYAGCQAVSMAGSPYDAFYWETYCLLGEPAMVPFLGRNNHLEWTLPDRLTAGSTHIQITASPLTRISATCDSLLLGTALCGDDGICTLILNKALDGDSLTLTATRPGAIPLVTMIPIESPSEGRMAVTQYILDNSVLTVTVRNVGQNTARQHSLQLMQDSTDLLAGAKFGTLPPILLPRLTPGADTSVVFNLGELNIGNEPLLSAKFVVADSMHEVYSTLTIAVPTPDLRPKIVEIGVLDSIGNRVQKLISGGNYLMTAKLSHPADSVKMSLGNGAELVDGELMSGMSEWDVALPFLMEESEHLFFTLTAFKDRWQHRYEGWLLPYDTWERFETGGFDNLPWQQSVLYPWRIDCMAHNGNYCARSATIGDAQKSTLMLDVVTLSDDSISFWYRVSSEGHDWLYFYIDGRKVGFWSGNSGWQRYVRPLRAGRHRLEWAYQKDASRSEREDCAYIDDIHLPLAVWQCRCGTSEQDTHTIAILPIEENRVFHVYPNPATDKVVIELDNSPLSRHIEVFDQYGRMVDKIFVAANCNSTQYFTTLLRFGVYSMVLHDQNGNHVQKIIVTK